jgi:predicted DNA-binding helix-hairpin-helix protein
MTIDEKLTILTDSAKYDVSCSSSGSVRTLDFGGVGSVGNGGICHAYSADGRCISLLKILFTNYCLYDCAYCVNRISNDIRRAAFTPEEVAQLTINFYRRNMIEGLFFSSGIITSEDHTMRLIVQTSQLADRVSSNIELPSSKSLALLAPDKTREKVLQPLTMAKNYSLEHQKRPIGMSTQLIIGATPESDLDERFDPKLAWALRNLHLFPIELNRADKETLLRIPGLGVRGVNKILKARRFRALSVYDLETMKISLKRLRYFVTVGGKMLVDRRMDYQQIQTELLSLPKPLPTTQPTLFDHFYLTVMGEF